MKSWADLAKNASSYYQDACLQKDTLSAIGTEDCLRISIFTIDVRLLNKFPVAEQITFWFSTNIIKSALSASFFLQKFISNIYRTYVHVKIFSPINAYIFRIFIMAATKK